MKMILQKTLYSQVEQIKTSEELEAVFNQPETYRKVTGIRAARKAGDTETAQRLKASLPGLVFVADDFSETVNKHGVRGRWRCQAAAHLYGLAVLDADHLKESPRTVFGRWTEARLRELGIYLVFVTSSDEGLKVVFKARKEWGNLIENVRAMGSELGLTIDESGKDASRMSFAPSSQAGDILFYDAEGLFGCENAEYDQLFGELYRQGNSQGSQASEPSARSSEVRKFRISEHAYKDVPLQKIVDCWVGPHLPQAGERHATSLLLADELRYICDSDPVVIEGVLRAQPWVADIVKERHENVAQTVKSALAYKEEKRIPKRMYRALEAAGVDVESGVSKLQLPYERWAESVGKSELGVYKPAIAFIDDPLIAPGGIVIAGGMCDTLLTHCWYRDWEGKPHRLNAISMAIGDPASGKGFAVDQDETLMEVMREADKPGRQAEREYKEGVQERGTSQKEQKKEALKRPKSIVRYCPVKTSNNVLYRRMNNNVEQLPNGEPYYLHTYTFTSELLSIVNARGSFQEKRDLMLQSFHNERNGVDYANADSINDTMPVFYNVVATGTGHALRKFVNPSNIGDGMATRITAFVMPHRRFRMRPLCAKPRSMAHVNELKMWSRRLDGLRGEIKGLERLVRHIYAIVAAKADEAGSQNDNVTVTMCKRMQDKLMAICIPQVITTQKSWEEFQRTMTATVTKKHLDFATLMFDILLTCEDTLFGQLWQDYYDNEQRDTQPRIVYDKTAQCFQQLPQQFTTTDVMNIWGFTNVTTASDKCRLLVDQHQAEKVKRGLYRKLVSAV